MALAAAALLAFLAVQDGPHAVPRPGPPTNADAWHMRNLVLGLEHIDTRPDRAGDLAGTVEQWDGLFRLLGRSHPWIAGRARLEGEALAVAVTVDLPGGVWPGRLTGQMVLPPFEGTPRPSALQIGRLPLPPGPTLALAQWAADQRFGPGSGSAALGIVEAMAIDGEDLRFEVRLPAGTEGLVGRNLLSAATGRPLPGRDEIVAFIDAFEHMAEGDGLPSSGSFLPWLQATIDLAIDKADPDDPERTLLAGFLALDRLCGSGGLWRLVPPAREGQRQDIRRPGICGSTGFHGRRDLRQHFVTAATVRLMSNRGVAVTAGEAKELSDLGGSGFDFTDIAGNNAGIRFVASFARTPPEDWPRLRALMLHEADVMIGLHGLPSAMRPEEFERRFGSVDSDDYRAVVEMIEGRIDRLPIHAWVAEAATDG